MSYYPVMIFPH